MKKIVAFLLAFVLVCGLSVSVSARQAEFQTIHELYQYWGEHGFPDYVCGVWSTDGGLENLTVSVTDNEAGEAGKAEILELVEEDSHITFTAGTYSYNQLLQVQREIDEHFRASKINTDIYQSSVMVQENHVEVGLDLKSQDENLLRFIRECEEEYGHQIQIVQGSKIELTVGKVPAASNHNVSLAWMVTLVGLICLGLICIGFYCRRRSEIAALVSGQEVVRRHSVSLRQVKRIIKENTLTPSPQLERQICSCLYEKIQKK